MYQRRAERNAEAAAGRLQAAAAGGADRAAQVELAEELVRRAHVGRKMERWIEILEDLFRIPFTKITFGLDFIFGLLPIVGDFTGLVCGLPLIGAAIKHRLPFRVVLVMVVNVLVDAVFGSVPLLGNLFDLFWKAHRKNLVLLKTPEALADVLREAWWKLAGLVAVMFLLALALVYLLVFFVWAYFKLLENALLPFG